MKKFSLFLCTILFSLLSLSQVKYDYKAQGIFNRGNVNRNVFNSSLSLKRQNDTLDYTLKSNYSFSTQDGEKIENDFLLNGNLDINKYKYVFMFISGGYETSLKRGIHDKFNIAPGLGYNFVRTDSIEVSLSFAPLMYEYIDFYEKSDIDLKRGSIRFKVKTVFKKFNIKTVLWYQPSYDVVSNRINLNFDLNIPLSKRFSLVTSYIYEYDELVDEGRQDFDSKLLFGIRIKN